MRRYIAIDRKGELAEMDIVVVAPAAIVPDLILVSGAA